MCAFIRHYKGCSKCMREKTLNLQSRKEAQRRVAGVAVLPGKVTVQVQVLADALHFRTIGDPSGLSNTETNYAEGENNIKH